MSASDVHEAVEEVARTSFGRLVAFLASRTGDVAAAEDALADAFEAALRTWPTVGVPERPVTWMITAARRAAIGRQRRADTAARAAPTLALLAEERSAFDDAAIPDKRLELLYACAHPAIDPSVHAPLMLQTVFGLDAARMSATFLVQPGTLGQRLVRAKRKIADARIPFELPQAGDIAPRTASVLEAVYGAYGAGWEDPGDLDPGRRGLTTEAIRLADLVVDLRPDDPEVLGLAALLHHLEARASARRDERGRFVPLTEQDPWRWNPHHLATGQLRSNRAWATGATGPFVVMASIASLHNRRALDGHVDWPTIAGLYDVLLLQRPTAGVAVARAAAHLEAGDPHVARAGLAAIDAALVERYQPYWTVLADVARACDDEATAAAARSAALLLTTDPAVLEHLRRRWHPGDP